MTPASLMILLMGAVALFPLFMAARPAPSRDADVLVVGAGISGLSAALEAGRGGARVRLVEMWSIFGGHAVMSQGGLAIVGSPLQKSSGIEDSTDLAYGDFLDWGEDPSPEWARYYVENSRAEIYDWLTAMGVQFEGLIRQPGNRVARFHETRGRGLGLVSPIYRECLKNPSISFDWNVQVRRLLTEEGRVVGVRGEDLRTGKLREFRSQAVILATGGFQSNIEMVREFWPENLPFPDRLLAGSGLNSLGSGHAIAQRAGAVLYNMDHQWNYVTGLPDPRYPGAERGLNARNLRSIWVNRQGRRFVNEWGDTKLTFPALLRQKPAMYWAIFDEEGKREFWVAGSDWGDFRRIEEIIFGNLDLVKSAPSIEELAGRVGLSAAALAETIRRYNEMIGKGEDVDFGRFGPGESGRPPKIEKPPFYAVQFFPLARKSMGGVRVDRSCRVLDRDERPIAGLYAVGELAGFAGINGKAGLEGTFLGPSIVTGRVAARAVLADLKLKPGPQAASAAPVERRPVPSSQVETESCEGCHNLSREVAIPRRGYSHFEKVHRVVLKDRLACGRCHAELAPYRASEHRIDPVAQIENCKFCHVAEER